MPAVPRIHIAFPPALALGARRPILSAEALQRLVAAKRIAGLRRDAPRSAR